MMGLRQKNIDYSICQALSYKSAGIDKAIIIYDMACQWYLQFHQRVEASLALQTPDHLETFPAVGNFHLSAHKLECFARFSLMFMQGAGHIDGEILETLWAPFNKISSTARSMSLVHR
jgi:Kyakuja-Dileera-Zisupton transposase